MHKAIILTSTLSFLTWGSFAALDGHCPPLGAVLPAPTSPSSHSTVKSAIKDAKNILHNITATFNSSGVAIGVKSIHESDLLFEYAYTPPNVDPRGVKKIDSDTVFRIASLSKVFPVLALLKLHGVSLDDSVTDYLPELRKLNEQARAKNSIWTVDWDDITLGALASHLGGMAADLFTDVQPYGDWTTLGFPPDDVSKNLNCSGLLGLPPCGEDVFDERFGERPPISLPFSDTPMYANIGWAIMGRVIEKVTKKSSADFIKDNIWGPIGMDRTFADTPADHLGFIPPGDLFWNATLGFEAPAGQYFSTINDLHAFGDALLKHKILSPAKTRKWLKPVSFTASPGTFIGQPWEIWRTQNLTKDGRVIDIYTKGGDLITYHSILALVPDYDLVVTVLVAGPEVNAGVVQLMVSNIVTALLPALEEAGKDQSKVAYAGTYSDAASNSSLTLSLDDSPGFSVTNWTVRGVDIIDTYLSIGVPPTFPTPPGLVRFRLYPSNIKTGHQSSWRAIFTIGTAEEIERAESQVAWPGALCNSWSASDRIVYQLLAQDHFVFTESNGKIATELELVGYRVTLKRED
ncbi:Fc.00g084990.m01.CDS01 [Cosmosporella sp. VM-42]